MIQLDMLGGQDAAMLVMLDIQNPYDQFAGMVIVNDCNRTGCFRVLRPFFFRPIRRGSDHEWFRNGLYP